MRILIAAALFFSSQAFASTQIVIPKDGSKATITLLAFTANPDATAMFNALSQAAIDMNGKITKHMEFKTSGGEQLFAIECVFSKLVPDTGSCIMVLQASPFLQMDPAHSRVKFELHGSDAALAASAFVQPSSGGTELYRSSDNHLVLSATPESEGAFTITYGY